MSLPISVIILTQDEEDNIRDCLESITSRCNEIFVVDSGSKDNTLVIAREYTDRIYTNPFIDYANQRNWAQKNLPIENEWVFHLDADERITAELFLELEWLFKGPLDKVYGFLVPRKTIFMGRWISHGGHYPVYHARIFKRAHGECEQRRYDQHFIVSGQTLTLKSDLINIITPDTRSMIKKLRRYSKLEAEELTTKKHCLQVRAYFSGSPISRRRWLRINFYERSPLFLRAFFYFFYRYFIRLGFLDGSEGLRFHFWQGLWYRLFVDYEVSKIIMRKYYNVCSLK
jgi:glycosyltransferase involved in cell wall biosynthesis